MNSYFDQLYHQACRRDVVAFAYQKYLSGNGINAKSSGCRSLYDSDLKFFGCLDRIMRYDGKQRLVSSYNEFLDSVISSDEIKQRMAYMAAAIKLRQLESFN